MSKNQKPTVPTHLEEIDALKFQLLQKDAQLLESNRVAIVNAQREVQGRMTEMGAQLQAKYNLGPADQVNFADLSIVRAPVDAKAPMGPRAVD